MPIKRINGCDRKSKANTPHNNNTCNGSLFIKKKESTKIDIIPAASVNIVGAAQSKSGEREATNINEPHTGIGAMYLKPNFWRIWSLFCFLTLT